MKSSPLQALTALTLLMSMTALADDVTPTRPVVLELYTAQGCSSCPPADALLGELAARPNIIALAFHVDYWDSDGWRDPFSIRDAVERQRRYVDNLKLPTPFTPQTILDGRASFLGSDKNRILDALAVAPAAPPVAVTLEVVPDSLNVLIAETDNRNTYDVNLVAYLPHAETAVGRGENKGRKLEEFNIVRQFRRLGAWKGQKATFQVPLKSFPADATRVAVFVQRKGQGEIDGAAAAILR